MPRILVGEIHARENGVGAREAHRACRPRRGGLTWGKERGKVIGWKLCHSKEGLARGTTLNQSQPIEQSCMCVFREGGSQCPLHPCELNHWLGRAQWVWPQQRVVLDFSAAAEGAGQICPLQLVLWGRICCLNRRLNCLQLQLFILITLTMLNI